MYKKEIDIILGLPWFEKLGTFILNMEKKFLVFPYKKKMMTFQDITMKSDSIVPSSKDLERHLKGDPSRKSMVNIKDTKVI
jgi:hypothetical protein